MASLRRSAQSPFYIACITLPGGARTNRSTKTPDRRLAQRLADDWQAAADKAREGRFIEAQARKVLSDILGLVGEQRLNNETVQSFLLAWVDGKDGNTARRYGSTIKKFLTSLGAKWNDQIAAIGHQDILAFIQKRGEAGVAPKTLSVDVRTLGAAFNIARKLGLVDANPVERALAVRPINVTCSQRECFSPEQVTALLNAAVGDWRTMVMLGYYTGARLSDCSTMKWESVDFVAGVVDFVPRKTKRKNKRVVVPIHPNLLAHLEKCAASDQPEIYLCPTLASKPTCGKNGLSTMFKRIMVKAGIEAQTVQGLGVRQFAKLSFHSLRHSFNSALANAGIDQETRMTLTGHSSILVNGGYTHLELPKLRQAVEKLPELTGRRSVETIPCAIVESASG